MGIERQPHALSSVEVIKVIRTTEAKGAGTKTDPVRMVIRYWDFDGKVIAEHDPLDYGELDCEYKD